MFTTRVPSLRSPELCCFCARIIGKVLLRKKVHTLTHNCDKEDRHEHTYTQTHRHTHITAPHPLGAQASHTQSANCTISSKVARSRVSMMSHFVTASLAGGFLLPCGFLSVTSIPRGCFWVSRAHDFGCGCQPSGLFRFLRALCVGRRVESGYQARHSSGATHARRERRASGRRELIAQREAQCRQCRSGGGAVQTQMQVA